MPRFHGPVDPSATAKPSKVQEQSTQYEPRTGVLCFRNLSRNLFCFHLVLVTALVALLTVRSFVSAVHNPHFHRLDWFLPLLASTGCAAIVGLAWHSFTLCSPSRTVKAAFWISPLLTCAVGILLVAVGSAGSLGVGVVALVSSIVQSLYSSWVSPRFDHAVRVVSVSTASPPAKTTALVLLTILLCTLFSAFLVVGVGAATSIGTKLDALFILVLLLSLAWTMQVIKNTLQVTISRVKYLNFASGTDLGTCIAFRDTLKNSLSSVCVGSALTPVLGLIQGSARAISSVSGDADEFMFSCANCYSGVASSLVRYGNRWGFVYVGVYDMGFAQASKDTWEMFTRVGLEPVIDSDLTASFCFLCGLVGGAVCALLGGSWSLVEHSGYTTETTIYAFVIGYFTCRAAMAWPQACVSAYHVAFAENPQSARFDATIPVRMEELERSRAQQSQTQRTTQLTEL